MNNKLSLRILIVDDEQIVHQTLTPYLQCSQYQIDNAYEGSTALQLIETNDYDLAFIDVRMPKIDGLSLLSRIRKICPELSVVIMTAHGEIDMVIKALRLGAVDFLRKPIKMLELDAVLEKAYGTGYLMRRQRYLEDSIKGIQNSGDLLLINSQLIGTSKAMNDVRKQIQLAVEAQCETILISGETGTGKEVIASTIHTMGGAKERPFIAVNCPALPDSLVESELFGYVKGAFTGALTDKPGAFELADGGTLFLDEIADLSPSAQAKLLRVLESRKVRRIGGIREKKVDIRLIAATNIPPEALITLKKIRNDLYFRLNLFIIKLLPLRERPQDIIPLAEYFLSNYLMRRRFQINGISEEAKDMLSIYDFPGNARELRNIIERAAILCRTGLIESKHLNITKKTKDQASSLSHSDEKQEHLGPSKSFANILSSPSTSHKEQERERILNALEKTRWNRRQTAKELGMPYSTLRYKLKKLGII